MNTSLDPRKNPMGFAGGLVASMFVAVAIFMYMLFLQAPYLTYENLPFPTTLEQVASGDVMPVYIVRCNSDPIPHNYNTTRSIERLDDRKAGDPKYVMLTPAEVNIPPGCSTSVSLLNRLPEHVPPGRYRLIGAAEVQTPFRTHFVQWYSQAFQVVAKR